MTPRTLLSLGAASLLGGVLLSGCLNLKPVSDPVRYFVLSPVGDAATARPDTAESPALGIEPIVLPAYLAKPWIVVRESDTEVRYSDFNKWAEYLDKGILRVQAQNLCRLLATDNVALEVWRPDSVDYSIQIEIGRFDVDTSGRAVLEANWQVRGKRTFTGHQVFEKTGPSLASDPAGAVSTLSELLAELSRTLAAELQK